ncbi:hypothetical protein [Kitasatospora aureofaciens]|uniref:hypothetical protein n=1 Tax=Kitasatospora aureofaciens TaxID=1894 RepID=UPI0005252E45|nr:hypothetical protein [Kitasatospora aureofaciens]
MHNLNFDPASPLGLRIVEFFNRIKTEIEANDGSWDGGDVVEALGVWFEELGIDADGDAIAAASAVPIPLQDCRGHHDCTTVYRAGDRSVPFGTYKTRAAAQDHAEDHAITVLGADSCHWEPSEPELDQEQVLYVHYGRAKCGTSITVTPIRVEERYDPDADM